MPPRARRSDSLGCVPTAPVECCDGAGGLGVLPVVANGLPFLLKLAMRAQARGCVSTRLRAQLPARACGEGYRLNARTRKAAICARVTEAVGQ